MFKLITPKGGTFEIDPRQVQGFEFELDGVRYELTVKEL